MTIRIAVVGVGNCASSLAQCIAADQEGALSDGVSHRVIGGYKVSDLEIVAAFDINAGKVGKDFAQAIHAAPNCTTERFKVRESNVVVSCGCLLDGVSPEMYEVVNVDPRSQDGSQEDVINVLIGSGAELVVSYLPVGSQKASEFYAEAAAAAGAGFVNCTPATIANSERFRRLFETQQLVLLGDDIKSQFGSTAIHRALLSLLIKKGLTVTHTFQVNLGGNTDFQNMDCGDRATQKKFTKERALRTLVNDSVGVSVTPSEFVPSLKDFKTGLFSIRGKGVLGMPFNLDLRIELEDSPNSAGVVVNAVRAAKVAADRGRAGVVEEVCPYFFKNPPVPATEDDSLRCLDEFLEEVK